MFIEIKDNDLFTWYGGSGTVYLCRVTDILKKFNREDTIVATILEYLITAGAEEQRTVIGKTTYFNRTSRDISPYDPNDFDTRTKLSKLINKVYEKEMERQK